MSSRVKATPLDEMLAAEHTGLYGVWGKVEDIFDKMGMMRSPLSPLYRFGFGFVVGSAVIWALRPSFAFDDQGQPLPFNFAGPQMSEDGEMVSYGTSTPWWLIPAVVGAGCGLLV
jgi:hypothetical protein